MKDFFQFIFKCMLGFIAMICDSSVNMEDTWTFILFGTLGVVIFLLVFFGLLWFIHKKFFVRKNFFAEHVWLVSFSSAFILTFIYFAIAYTFFYQ